MANFGETLKRERELRKISLREVSEATKIGLRYLEAMEDNRLEQLPGGVFNKGFIRAYAKFIGLDPETILNVYLYDVAHRQRSAPERILVPRLEAEDAKEDAKPVLPLSAASSSPSRPRGRWIAAAAVAFAIVMAGGLLILLRAPAGTLVDVDPRQEAPVQAGLLRPAPIVSPAAPETARPAETRTPSAATDGAAAETAPRAEMPKTAPVDTNLALFLVTSQSNEIDVYCDGVEKVSRELAAGETVAVSCAGEFILNVENAGVLTVKINGHECLPLGEAGEALEGYTLDARKAREICPRDKERS